MHRLFSFSAQLATDYSGAWDTSDNRTFVVTVTEVAEDFIAPHPTEVEHIRLQPGVDLVAAWGRSGCSPPEA